MQRVISYPQSSRQVQGEPPHQGSLSRVGSLAVWLRRPFRSHTDTPTMVAEGDQVGLSDGRRRFKRTSIATRANRQHRSRPPSKGTLRLVSTAPFRSPPRERLNAHTRGDALGCSRRHPARIIAATVPVSVGECERFACQIGGYVAGFT